MTTLKSQHFEQDINILRNDTAQRITQCTHKHIFASSILDLRFSSYKYGHKSHKRIHEIYLLKQKALFALVPLVTHELCKLQNTINGIGLQFSSKQESRLVGYIIPYTCWLPSHTWDSFLVHFCTMVWPWMPAPMSPIDPGHRSEVNVFAIGHVEHRWEVMLIHVTMWHTKFKKFGVVLGVRYNGMAHSSRELKPLWPLPPLLDINFRPHVPIVPPSAMRSWVIKCLQKTDICVHQVLVGVSEAPQRNARLG